MRVKLIVAATVAALAVLSGSSGAATNVEVVTSFAYGPAAGAHSVPAVACRVTVPAGADGVAVLDAAVSARCVTGYQLKVFDFGRFVECVSRVCQGQSPSGVLLWYWAMRLQGVYTSYGVDGYRAAQGDWLSFAYEPFPCVPWGC